MAKKKKNDKKTENKISGNSRKRVRRTGPQKSVFREYAESFGVAIIIALLVRAFIFSAYKIPTGSMEKTLLVGDFIFVNKYQGVTSEGFLLGQVETNHNEPLPGNSLTITVYDGTTFLDTHSIVPINDGMWHMATFVYEETADFFRICMPNLHYSLHFLLFGHVHHYMHLL